MLEEQAQGVISIHAPAGGATTVGTAERGNLAISIHAPAGGATLAFQRKEE